MTAENPNFRLCDHVKDDGACCMAPAMRTSRYCYFHTRDHQRRRNLSQAADIRAHQPSGIPPDQLEDQVMQALALPNLEDAVALQIALSTVIRALAAGHLRPIRASLLLRGLRTAVVNLRNLPEAPPADDFADLDPEPIPPLLPISAPDPWLVEEDAAETGLGKPEAGNGEPAAGPSNEEHSQPRCRAS